MGKNITVINKLKKDEYGVSGEIYFPLFEKDIEISIYPDDYDGLKEGEDTEINSDTDQEILNLIEYAKKCTDYLQHLSDSMVDRLCKYTLRYCQNMKDLVGEDEIEVPSDLEPKEILDYVNPSSLIIETPTNENIIGFHMELNCDWEIEHGLEWTIKDDKIRYVGPFDGESPWAESRLAYMGFYDDAKDTILNYADKE